jgi:hypothetical protein
MSHCKYIVIYTYKEHVRQKEGVREGGTERERKRERVFNL